MRQPERCAYCAKPATYSIHGYESKVCSDCRIKLISALENAEYIKPLKQTFTGYAYREFRNDGKGGVESRINVVGHEDYDWKPCVVRFSRGTTTIENLRAYLNALEDV